MPVKVIKVKSEVSDYPEHVESPRDAYVLSLNDPQANATRGFPNNYIRTTKYTILTFLPKNLFEQFRRLSNFYFLTIVIVQLIPQITPLVPVTSILPLVFVLAVTALKEAVEDFYRHKADKKSNTQKFQAIRDGKLVDVESQHIKAGDIVYVEKNQPFPADLVLLSSSIDDGVCYVETANLDGETNLKQRKALDVTSGMRDVLDLSVLRGAIQCESPNERLYQFSGRLVLSIENEKKVYSLSSNQFLHRSAKLRNTKFVYGVVVYAGEDTKLFLNQQPPPSKFSLVERVLNRFILAVFIFQMFVCLLDASLSGFFESNYTIHMWYIGKNPFTVPVFALRNFFTYFVLFNTMIPQSLWVTLELVKVGQARFMSWDNKMRVGEQEMQPKTSNLNEDLGRIQHIFSDKTGTLTENSMNFKKCSIDGATYGEETDTISNALHDTGISQRDVENIRLFMNVMSLCHSVVPEVNESTGQTSYNSQSPDETALVEIARSNGYIFKGRAAKEVIVEELGKEVRYQLLATLDFTSARRRMSIIVEAPDGRVLLLSKGADLVIYDRLIDGYEKLKAATSEHLRQFSRDGLRTLVFAYKEVTKEELSNWLGIYHKAITSIDNREEAVEAACEIIENDLILLGCTAIEDKLQDEVPETIHYLLKAGIHIWVLTGDKQETAINIGYSSRLLTPEMDLIIINAENSEICGEMLRVNLEKYCNMTEGHITGGAVNQEEEQKSLGLVIDGHSLGFALHDHVDAFLALGKVCSSVICCRVTPLQKALVVRVVKHGEGKITCSIGDGANDVSMIQEAHVGVGIFGKEGTQAALASDYAIHQFSHLKRLLCIHGRYSYLRITGLIQYSFYKNMAFTLCMVYFSFFNGFTGQTLFDAWIITLYNIVFTSIPPIVYGLFERDLDDIVISRHPQSYQRMQKGYLFTKTSFVLWLVESIWHSIVTYFGVILLFSNDVLRISGVNADIWSMGCFASTIAIVIVNLRMALETKTWNILTHISIWGSILAYFVTLFVYCAFSTLNLTSMYFIVYFMVATPGFWLLVVLCSIVALLPDFAIKYVSRQYRPEDWQILREKYL